MLRASKISFAWVLSLMVIVLMVSPLAFANNHEVGGVTPDSNTLGGVTPDSDGVGSVTPDAPGDISVTPSFPNPLKVDSISGFVTEVVRLLITIGIPIATIFIIYAGFKFVTAGGNTTKIDEAKAMLLWTVVGTAVLLGAAIIANVVKNTITNIGA